MKLVCIKRAKERTASTERKVPPLVIYSVLFWISYAQPHYKNDSIYLSPKRYMMIFKKTAGDDAKLNLHWTELMIKLFKDYKIIRGWTVIINHNNNKILYLFDEV